MFRSLKLEELKDFGFNIKCKSSLENVQKFYILSKLNNEITWNNDNEWILLNKKDLLSLSKKINDFIQRVFNIEKRINEKILKSTTFNELFNIKKEILNLDWENYDL